MRLGQLARKYNIKQDAIILYLDEIQPELSSYHHNSKLSNDVEGLIADHFSLSPKTIEEVKEEQIEEILDEAEDQNLEVEEALDEKKTEADLQQELDPTLPPIQASTAIKKKEEKQEENSIDTDTLMQLLEADEASKDLSKITHIKASKKELIGLKVVGKIELPESKSKSDDKSEDQTSKPVVIKRSKSLQLSEEERNNRRQKIKGQKERYEARQEKQRIETEKEKKKAQNRARYKEKMQKVKPTQAKQKIPVEEIVVKENDQPKAFKSLSIFDWFWKLFNL